MRLGKSDKYNAGATLSDDERKKLKEFSERMFEKYGVSDHGKMSDRLVDLILHVRALNSDE